MRRRSEVGDVLGKVERAPFMAENESLCAVEVLEEGLGAANGPRPKVCCGTPGAGRLTICVRLSSMDATCRVRAMRAYHGRTQCADCAVEVICCIRANARRKASNVDTRCASVAGESAY